MSSNETNYVQIKTALVSVYHKQGLDEVIRKLHQSGVRLLSTGGTKAYIEDLKIPVRAVEDITSYPSILGGRVKTLHPKIFGGILSRRDLHSDQEHVKAYDIPQIDLVIVDLYPFEDTLASGAEEAAVIEKIDIGGISLIRAAAKNHKDVAIVASQEKYAHLLSLLETKECGTELADRKSLAAHAFQVSSHYDTAIFNYFNQTEEIPVFKQSLHQGKALRYGENPHQKGFFFGDFESIFEQLHGKEISYNNLLDIDAAVQLISEFDEITFAILKHNNACGLASRSNLLDAWNDALAGDPVSAFGGVLITNTEVDADTATEINKLFFEVIIAPAYQPEALSVLETKKNRIILVQKQKQAPQQIGRTILNGMLVQDKDQKTETPEDLRSVTKLSPNDSEVSDLLFANKIVKHTKSNAIVLSKNKQLIASGVGQTSRVDALKQAIDKANSFGFELKGSVLASDAFFPFADSVEIAHRAGVESIIQPGGSVRDNDSIEYCNQHKMKMVFTGSRHFKH